MTRKDDTSHPPKGNGATQAPGGFVDPSNREPSPSTQQTRDDQAARSVMHPDTYDPEWRYYHGAWGG